MKIKKEDAVALLKECGYEEAETYSPARLQKKMEGLPKALNEDNQPESKAGKKLLKQLTEAVKAKEEITIITAEGETEEAGAKKEAKAEKKEAKKAPAKAKEEEEDDDEEADDEEESDEDDEEADDEESDDDEEESDDEEEDDEEEKPAKKKGPPKGTKPPASAGGEGKPGVIASIVEFLQNGTEAKPISKKGILKKLVARFPDRPEDSMMKTVNVQVPNRIQNDKKLTVHSKDVEGTKKYWINPDEQKSKPKSDKAPAKGDKKKGKKDEEEDDED